MKYKTIKGIAKDLAESEQQTKATTENRHIWHRLDLTESDNTEIKINTKSIVNILENANGKENNVILLELKQVIKNFFLGFVVQDEIIKTCKNNKIYIILGV